jgi:hypothetical protein
MWKKLSIVLAIGISLIGCKADELEISMKTSDLLSVRNGGNEVAEFEAVFSMVGELDNESRALVDALENILVKYVYIDDFEIKTLPIRLTQTPPTCRVLPLSRVKLAEGRCPDVARDTKERAEGVERVEPPVEAECELVEVGL